MFKTKETVDNPYEKWTNKELQDLLKNRKLQISGKKNILINRLRKSESGDKLKKKKVRTSKRVSSRPMTPLFPGETYLSIIPLDLLILIISDLTLRNLSDLCNQSEKIHRRLCENDEFWARLYKFTRKGPVPKDVKTWYLDMMDKYVGYYESGKYSDGIRWIAGFGFLNEIKELIQKSGKQITPRTLSLALSNATEYPEVVRYLISQGANNDYNALFSATSKGNLDSIKQLMGIRKTTGDLNHAFLCAANGGHLDVIEYLENFEPSNPNYISVGAISGGHVDLLNRAVKMGATQYKDAFSEYYHPPGSLDVVKRLVELGARNPENMLFTWPDYNIADNIDESLRIFSYLLKNFGRDYGQILKHVTVHPSPEFSKFLIINYGSHLTQNDLNDALIEAVRYGNLDNINLLLESGANNYDDALSAMIKWGGRNAKIEASILKHKKKR